MKLESVLKTPKSLWENRSDIAKERPLSVPFESGSMKFDLTKADNNRCVCLFSEAREADAYRILRTQIQQRAEEKNWHSLMITSAHPGEGKTLTAINLAVIFAKSMDGCAVLVDCDLRRQDVHQRLGVPGKMGLTDYLLDGQPLDDIMIRADIEKLGIISGGRIIHDSSEMLGSREMRRFVSEMKDQHEEPYVFFDVPPLLGRADAVALTPLTDGVIMVVEAGRTSVHDVRKALDLIPEDKFLGFVLNRL